jgi:hypothetical protein
LDDRQREFLRGLLEVHAELPLVTGRAGQLVLDALDSLYRVPCSHEERLPPGLYSGLLAELVALSTCEDEVIRTGAKACWGFLEPLAFVDGLRAAVPGLDVPHEWRPGLEYASRAVAAMPAGPIPTLAILDKAIRALTVGHATDLARVWLTGTKSNANHLDLQATHGVTVEPHDPVLPQAEASDLAAALRSCSLLPRPIYVGSMPC